ncbi:type III-A CRISPR-associated protein Cas10/Csm1 [Dehalococcoidales bacterium]|nr:type III-A CRISPR-associated protein Cas10/Csm1 [Dehalococcoidales bacterium]
MAFLDEILEESPSKDSVRYLAARHHKPGTPLQRLIQLADSISSKEREKYGVSGNWYKRRRLSSVFEKVTLERVIPSQRQFRYRLSSLSLDKNSFPKKLEEGESLVCQYKKLWEGFSNGEKCKSFREELKELECEVRQSGNKFALLFNSLYSLLQKYTWCMPSYTQTDCDISLFDHLRTTSAIALCLYNAQNSPQALEKEFLLVEGDIWGMQKFIYRLAQPTGVKHIARMLRGRSFYLTLLPLILARYIIWQLDLTIAHILWCGGGKFVLLLPNTNDAKEKLKNIKSEISNWFLKEFESELGLSWGQVEASREQMEDFGTLLDELSVKVEEGKQKKFIEKLPVKEWLPFKNGCRVCGLGEGCGSEEICERCEFQRRIGECLPKKANYLVIAKGKVEEAPGFSIPFGNFGIVYLVEKKEEADWFVKSNEVTEILAVNAPSFPLGSTFIGKETAWARENFEIEETEVEEGHILPFECLAQMSEGDERLGVLKMDIDHLRLIFALGLEDKSISRIATMSRELDWFFTGYVNTIAREVFEEWKKKEISFNKNRVNGCIYTVYSGGDDLVVVAPWSEAVEFAERLHQDFKEFTCQNPDIDLSAGIFLCKSKFPISRASILATEALDKAKGKGKKRICLFKEGATWERRDNIPGFGQLLELSETLARAVNENKLPRRFLHRLIQLRRDFVKGEIDLNYIPALVYLVIRNISDENLKNILWSCFISGPDAQGFFRKCLIPASIALLKTRGG